MEYSILLAVIVSAILIMQFYVKRGYQGRLKKESDTVGQQYSPGHTESAITTTTNSTSNTEVAEGVQSVDITADSTMEKKETVDSYATN